MIMGCDNMGLFMNKGEHPDVFMNRGNIAEPNQAYFKMDYFQELMKEQEKVNDSLFKSYRNLSFHYHEQKKTQARHWKDVTNQLNDLRESNLQHQKFESNAMEWLTMLEENNVKLQSVLEKEGLLKQEIMDQINDVSQSNQEIVNHLGKYEITNQQITEQMEELFDLHKQLSDQFSKHDDDQSKVLGQLENQEALMEKTYRQINNIRSILFERASFLAEKIENSYNLTSSFIYKLFSGSDQPLTLYMANKKKGGKSD